MLDFIKSLERLSHENIEINDGDYIGDDGLLYCGKCKSRKQMRIVYCGVELTPMCLCECEAEKREEENRKRKADELRDEISRMRSVGFSDAEMRKWTFENDDRANEKLSGVCKRYVDNWTMMLDAGKGLLLYGTVGTGKTYMSACIANSLIDSGVPCLVTNFARIINRLQSDFDGRQEYIDGLKKYKLLVIDDLASERDTEYMGEIVQTIIDERYRSGLPLIVTTNLSGDDLKRPADIRKQRIFSRLFEMCIPVEVKGMDRRKAKLKKDYSEFEKVLGL